MSNIVGTPQKVTINGLTFNVMSDANFNQIKGKYTTEAVPTTGGNIMQKTLRSQNVESINLQCNAEEAEILKTLSESVENFPMSYKTAAGKSYRAVGSIDFEGHDTEKGVAVIKMLPESIEGWVLF